MKSLRSLLLACLLAGCMEAGSSGSGFGTSGYSSSFDFAPSQDLSAQVPQVNQLRPLTAYAASLRSRIPPSEAARQCNWVSGEPFPMPQRQLQTYLSQEEATASSAGNRMPFEGNRAFREGAFMAARAAAHLIGNRSPGVAQQFSRALLANARAGAGLDTSALTRGGTPFTPDTAAAVEDATTWTLSYLLVEDRVPLAQAERQEVRSWLDALLRTYIDGYRRWHGTPDLRARWLIGHAEMARGLLRNEPSRFNRGARDVAAFVSWTRPDGSHRFGASRGNRATFYQGASLNMAMDSFILFDSQGLPARSVLLPTAERMAGFWAQAYQDPNVIYPYARENEAVSTGSDYRRQERRQYAAGADVVLAIAPRSAAAPALRQVSAQARRYPSVYSPSFNMSCIAAGLD